MLYRRRLRRRQRRPRSRRRQDLPACLTRQGWRSFLPEAPLRAAVLIAFASLSLIALAGFVSRGGSSEDVQQTTTIEVGNLWYCGADSPPGCMLDSDFDFLNGIDDVDLITTVSVGDTVTWNFVEGTKKNMDAHTTTECGGVCGTPNPAPKPDPLWDSGEVDASGTFSLTFDTPGKFVYRCETHAFQMSGIILVEEPGPAPTPSPEGSPETSPQPSPPSITPTPDMPTLPGGGGAPPAQAGTSIPWWLLIAGGGFLMVSASLLALRLRR